MLKHRPEPLPEPLPPGIDALIVSSPPTAPYVKLVAAPDGLRVYVNDRPASAVGWDTLRAMYRRMRAREAQLELFDLQLHQPL